MLSRFGNENPDGGVVKTHAKQLAARAALGNISNKTKAPEIKKDVTQVCEVLCFCILYF